MLIYSVFREYEVQKPLLASYGILLNKNTLEAFKNCNKIALLEELGQELWQDITGGEALDNPALLSRFYLLTYAVNVTFIPTVQLLLVTASASVYLLCFFSGS
jgi:hypothetical protein